MPINREYLKILKGFEILSFIIAITIIMIYPGCDEAKTSYEQYYQKGIEDGIQQKFQQAKIKFEKALKINPLYTPAGGSLRIVKDAIEEKIAAQVAVHLFKAIDYGNLLEPDKKIDEINKALQINPKYALAYNERGIAYANKGLFKQAISDRDKAISLEPTYPDSYYNKALACEKTGRLLEAIEAYRLFLKYAPEHYKRHVQYAEKRIKELRIKLGNLGPVI